MTGPMTLVEVAGWDLPLLRGAVGTLGLVADRLVPWRARLEAVGREMAAAQCWSGPAGAAAAAALADLSMVTSGLQSALSTAQGSLQTLVTDAADAQELAAAALAAAAAGDVPLDAAGHPVPDRAAHPEMDADQRAVLAARQHAAQRVTTLAAQALAAAARVLASAMAAGEPLAQLGGIDAAGVVRFDDLVTRLDLVVPPLVPHAQSPSRVAGWWSALSTAQRQAALSAHPAAIGPLEGLPGWARDEANRRLLVSALRNLPAGGEERAMAVAVAAEIGRQEAAGHPIQLLQFDPAADLMVLAFGDVDTAAAIGVMVPGIFNTPADDLPALTEDASDVAAAAIAAAPGLTVATVVWLGYRTPGLFGATFRWAAERAAPALDGELDGLAAARATPGARPAPRTTVLAHSYGTLVTAKAARQPGRLAADAVVLLGSPGVDAWSASSLEAPEVYGAWSPADPVVIFGPFGPSPIDPWFGDTPLPTDPTQLHTQYYDRDRPTLAAIGEVVAGTRPHN